jgi:hypothetical protein
MSHVINPVSAFVTAAICGIAGRIFLILTGISAHRIRALAEGMRIGDRARHVGGCTALCAGIIDVGTPLR